MKFVSSCTVGWLVPGVLPKWYTRLGCFARIVGWLVPGVLPKSYSMLGCFARFFECLASLDDLSRVSCPNSIRSNRRREGEVRQGVLPKSTWRWDDLSRVSRSNSIKVRMTCSGYLSEIVYKVGCFTGYEWLGWLKIITTPSQLQKWKTPFIWPAHWAFGFWRREFTR